MVGFPERFKKLREERKWTQEDVAKILKTTRSTIGDYETGRKMPKYDRLIQIADLFGTSVDFLLGHTDVREPVDELKRDLESKVIDLETIIKHRYPTRGGKPISEEEARKWNLLFEKIFEVMAQELADKEKRNGTNGR